MKNEVLLILLYPSWNPGLANSRVGCVVICAAALLGLVAGVMSGAAEFLGVHALALVLRHVLKGSFEIQKEMQVVKHYLLEP